METNSGSLFEAFLNQHDDEKWRVVIQTLLPSIHEVDKRATQIWFYFYPISLLHALQEAEDLETLTQTLQLNGKVYLKDQVDDSHHFLYGHRYWPQVKTAVANLALSSAAPKSLELSAQILDVAREVARQIKVDAALVVGVTAAAFITLQQVGIEAFKAATGKISLDKKVASKTPEQILRDRARDEGQGVFGFLRGERKQYKVTFNENEAEANFKIISTQHLTTAAAEDKRDFHSQDPRCVTGEGPIPIECRSAACGTCWVGVLGGNDKVSKIEALEYRRIKEFGYIDSEEDRPLIRLACMTQAEGSVSIVIPPWNGVFGKYLRSQRAREAQVVTGND
jgi:ferredoxin